MSNEGIFEDFPKILKKWGGDDQTKSRKYIRMDVHEEEIAKRDAEINRLNSE